MVFAIATFLRRQLFFTWASGRHMASTSNPVLPAYGKVKAFIKKRISAGTWKPGDPVPSESVLMV